MSFVPIRTTLALLALLSTAAQAGEAVDPHFLDLLKSEAHRAAVLKVATDQAGELPGACATARFQPIGEIQFFLPPQTDGAGRVVHGLWREQVASAGCGTVVLLNVFSLAEPSGEPKLLGGLPGTTRADPVLQKSGLPIAVRGLPATAAACHDIRIVDTALSKDAPKDRMASWHEDWTVLACDEAYQVPLRFTPTADGATIGLDTPPPSKG